MELNEELKVLRLTELVEGDEYFIQFYKNYEWFNNYGVNEYCEKYTFIKEYIEIDNTYISIKTYLFVGKASRTVELTVINILEDYFTPPFKSHRIIYWRNPWSPNPSYITSITCDIYKLTDEYSYVLK